MGVSCLDYSHVHGTCCPKCIVVPRSVCSIMQQVLSINDIMVYAPSLCLCHDWTAEWGLCNDRLRCCKKNSFGSKLASKTIGQIGQLASFLLVIVYY